MAMDVDNDDVVDHSDIDIEHMEGQPAVEPAMDTAHAKIQSLADKSTALAFGQVPLEETEQPTFLAQNPSNAVCPPGQPKRPTTLQLSDIHRMNANNSPPLFISPTTPVRRRPGSSRRRRNGGLARPRKYNL